MDGRTDGRTDRQTDRQPDRRIQQKSREKIAFEITSLNINKIAKFSLIENRIKSSGYFKVLDPTYHDARLWKDQLEILGSRKL